MKAFIIYEGSVVDNLPELEVGDKGIDISFDIIQENGAAVNLAGMTIQFKAKKLNDFDEYLFSKSCSITDEPGGRLKLSIIDGNLSDSGSYLCSLELTKTDFKSSISLGYLNIREDN